jgi:hypothetical protein
MVFKTNLEGMSQADFLIYAQEKLKRRGEMAVK